MLSGEGVDPLEREACQLVLGYLGQAFDSNIPAPLLALDLCFLTHQNIEEPWDKPSFPCTGPAFVAFQTQ